MPELQAAANERPDTELVTVMIAGKKQHANAVVRSKAFVGPVLLDSGSQLRRRYDINKVPYTLVLDATGHAKVAAFGGQNKKALLGLIDRVR